MNEKRRERISAFLREAMPDFFHEKIIQEPGVLISVLHIELAGKGSRANVFVSVYPDSARESIAKQLKMRENRATHFVRSRIASKYCPAIRFFLTDQAMLGRQIVTE